MKEARVFHSEAEFRRWFEDNLDVVGVKRIILSQEPCPDYVVEMLDGTIARVEAELFAINFRYHKHDPSKVDFILAGYSKSDKVDGVRVVAINRLWIWEVEGIDPIDSTEPLSSAETDLLRALYFSGSRSVAALADADGGGDQELWLRVSPSFIEALPRGRDEGLMSFMSPATKDFIRKHHHALLGAALSTAIVEALERLQRRGYAKYQPLNLLSAMFDGVVLRHDAYLPTELQLTSEGRVVASKLGLFRGDT